MFLRSSAGEEHVGRDRTCPECGSVLPADAPKGLCPKCLLRVGTGWGGSGPELRGIGAGVDASGARVDSPFRGPHEPGSFDPSVLPVIFGGYELVEELGRGGMGVVYKAIQIALGRTVALKMVLHGQFADVAFLDRFHIEAEAAAHLDHPNIVPIYEVGQHAGQPYYSMKFVDGQSLDRLLERGPVPPKEAARLMAKVAHAVAFAHMHGVLHRDIKPHNILLDANGEPHLADFGLAKLLNEGTALTASVTVVGSPEFMAPEQAEGKAKRLTTAADVYALGAVLFALLTGKAAFHAGTPFLTLREVLERQPPRPRALNPAVARDLETICLKCLQKEPGKRYATAQALAEDLESWLRAEPIQARRATRFERVWLSCRRRPVRAGLMGALALTLLAGLNGVLWESERARAGELRARQNAYAADMNLAQTALEKSDLPGALQVLERERPPAWRKDLRGWEWRYLWQRCQGEERFQLCKYPEPVGALAFSGDGAWLALRRESGRVALYDAPARSLTMELPGAGSVAALAFSPLGDLLAYGAEQDDGLPYTCLYEVAQRKEFGRLPGSAPAAHCAFSPDGSRMATWATDDQVSLWLVRPLEKLTNFHTARSPLPYSRMLFAPAGTVLAFGQGTEIVLWNWGTGDTRRIQVSELDGEVATLAFSPDGRSLAAGGRRILIWDISKVWDLPPDRSVPVLRRSKKLPRSWILCLAFSPDGQTLATGESDSRIGLWDAETLTDSQRLQGHSRRVLAVAFSPNGKDLVSSGRDGSVRYWDPAGRPETLLPAVSRGAFTFVSDTGQFIVLNKLDGVAWRWSIDPLQQIEALTFLGTGNCSVSCSPDGCLLAVGDPAGNIRIWNYTTQAPLTRLENAKAPVVGLTFEGGGRTLKAELGTKSSGEQVFKFWDTRAWDRIQMPPDFPGPPMRWAGVSPDNRILAVLDTEGTVAWWEKDSRHRLAVHQGYFAASDGYLSFSPDSRLLAGAGANSLATLWNIDDDTTNGTIRADLRAIHGLGFSPRGDRLLIGGEDPSEVVQLLDLGSQRHVATLLVQSQFSKLPSQADEFWLLEMSADGDTLAVIGPDDIPIVWHAPSWSEIDLAQRHSK